MEPWLRRSIGLAALMAPGLHLAAPGLNLVLGILPVPAILETLGSALRSVGLMGMGLALWRSRIPDAPTA